MSLSGPEANSANSLRTDSGTLFMMFVPGGSLWVPSQEYTYPYFKNPVNALKHSSGASVII